MDKIHSSDLFFSFVRPRLSLFESWNHRIEYMAMILDID